MKRYGEFLTSDEDRMFVESIRRYIDQEVMPVRNDLDTDYSVFERVYQGLVELGIQRRGFAERYGGLAIRSAVTASCSYRVIWWTRISVVTDPVFAARC